MGVTYSPVPMLICLACALLPFAGVQVSYLLAAGAGDVPWCFPYLDSCTSISATGRQGPASFLFRGVMLPSSTLIAVFWWLHGSWLRQAAPTLQPRARRTMLVLGWGACLGLIMYVTVLGEAGHLWRTQRRVGTILFFSLTYLSQLLLAAQLWRLPPAINKHAAPVARWMLRLCVLMLCIGVGSVVIRALDPIWHDAIEDAVEWQLALLLQLNFLFCALLWRRGSWHLTFRPPQR